MRWAPGRVCVRARAAQPTVALCGPAHVVQITERKEQIVKLTSEVESIASATVRVPIKRSALASRARAQSAPPVVTGETGAAASMPGTRAPSTVVETDLEGDALDEPEGKADDEGEGEELWSYVTAESALPDFAQPGVSVPAASAALLSTSVSQPEAMTALEAKNEHGASVRAAADAHLRFVVEGLVHVRAGVAGLRLR